MNEVIIVLIWNVIIIGIFSIIDAICFNSKCTDKLYKILTISICILDIPYVIIRTANGDWLSVCILSVVVFFALYTELKWFKEKK